MAKTNEKMVMVSVPYDPTQPDSHGYFVGVNGKNWILPHGQTVEVPDYVAEEFLRGQNAGNVIIRERNALKVKKED